MIGELIKTNSQFITLLNIILIKKPKSQRIAHHKLMSNHPESKIFKSSQKPTNHKVSTTCLNTPPRRSQQQQISIKNKQCPYHFNQPSHVCLTCRRSICLRCAITYCQQHTIHPEEDILPLLLVDLEKLTIQPRIQDMQLRLKQSQQRQEYLRRKIQKMLEQIEQNFQHTQSMLEKKKEQIVKYFKQELQVKFIEEYHKYDVEIEQKIEWLRRLQESIPRCSRIEELDKLASLIKKQVPSAETMSKTELKISKLIAGKDKIKISSIWSQERLESLLFEIENIPYRIKQGNLNSSFANTTHITGSTKKKRITTEISDNKHDKYDRHDRVQFTSNFNSNNNSNKNPFAGMINSGSNSRFSTGRKLDH